ncbi:hypothetical protein [Streptomyces sp. NRRL WC-3742]|uniref:hypothetical protein n=1 Tax=Streptomyces sp. NRRL WC-3742 TaxID=1463934 RepID=UPI0004C861E4|nr:hypothetical protein [Streptomyces sp. NRRL WC-3742]
MRLLRRRRVVRLVKLGRRVGTVGALGAAGVLLSSGALAHADAAAEPEPAATPEPAAAQFAPLLGDSVGPDAGLFAVGGGLLVSAGGAALWLKRRRAGEADE